MWAFRNIREKSGRVTEEGEVDEETSRGRAEGGGGSGVVWCIYAVPCTVDGVSCYRPLRLLWQPRLLHKAGWGSAVAICYLCYLRKQ